MVEKNLDIIYNKEYLVIVPKMTEKLIDSISFTFGNTILMENNLEEIRNVANFINKNNFKQIILVDYQMEYIELISKIEKRHTIKSIFTKALGALSDTFILSLFNSIYKLYKDEKIESIAFLDKGFYETFKHKGDNVYFISLDLKKGPAENATIDYQEIGVLNSQDNMKHSFFNELSAIKLNGKFIAKLPFKSKDTESFLKTFNQKARTCNQELLLKNNCLNLYINFTDNDPTIFLRSMDSNVPCILGNTELLDHNEYLKKYLVLKSDDDINEISEKIDLVSKNREKILKEYQTFRDNYSNQSKKLVETFLNCEIETEEESQKNDLLLSIVVPVYNVEKYLEKSLDSILEALIEKENVEILLINDGSKDDSEKIIEKYAKQYPKLIRYIKQENHGLGNVRNVGLAEARGKYIASIDSDDTINIDFFKDAIEYLNKDVDVVIYDWLTITTETKFETSASDWVFNNDNWNRYEALLYTTIMPSTCNKIIKSSLFKELGIKYIEDKFEDLSTNPFILFRSKRIKYINKPYYEYFIRSNSIMRSSAGLSMIDVIKLVEERIHKYSKLINVDINDFKYYTYSWRIEEYIMNQLYTIPEEEIHDFIKHFNNNIKGIMTEVFHNDRYLDMLDKLDKSEKEFILERNKAFSNNTLEEFIKKARKKENFFKLTPPIIYYGKN